MSETRSRLIEAFPRLRAANEALMAFNVENKDQTLGMDEMIRADLLFAQVESERRIYNECLKAYLADRGTVWE